MCKKPGDKSMFSFINMNIFSITAISLSLLLGIIAFSPLLTALARKTVALPKLPSQRATSDTIIGVKLRRAKSI
jgi:hypothetical protein